MDHAAEERNELSKQRSPSKDADSRFMQLDADIITNDKLCCAACAHLWAHHTVECGIYEQKPLSVLRGGDCPDLEPR